VINVKEGSSEEGHGKKSSFKGGQKEDNNSTERHKRPPIS
jgi:hypothetical protein